MRDTSFAANWLIFRNLGESPISHIELRTDGSITGGAFGEFWWSCQSGFLVIEDSATRRLFQFRLQVAPFVITLVGIFCGSDSGNNEFSCTMRRCGERHPVLYGTLGLVSQTEAEFMKRFRGATDFTHVLAGETVGTRRPHSIYFGLGANRLADHPPYDCKPHYDAPPVYFHVLHGCDLVGGTVVFDRFGRPLWDTTYQAELRSRSSNVSMLEDDLTRTLVSNAYAVDQYISGTAVLFSTLNDNFGHWHTQSATCIGIIEMLEHLKLIFRQNIKIVVTRGVQAELFREASLKRLGLESMEIVNPVNQDGSRRDLKFERLIVPSYARVSINETWHPKPILDLARHLRSGKNEQHRLFLSRRDVGGRRGLINEDEVFESLSHLGFDSIECGNMTYESQLTAFASAEIVVSPHAGALSNMLAAEPGLRVIELLHTHQPSCWYRNLAFICDHEYHAMFFPTYGSEPNWESGFIADPKAVVRLIDQLL